MIRYSAECKERVGRKMMRLNHQGVTGICRGTGIPVPRLYAWKHPFREKGCVVPAETSQPDSWGKQAKPAALMELALMKAKADLRGTWMADPSEALAA